MFNVKNIKLSIKVNELETDKVLNHFQTNHQGYKIKTNYIIVEKNTYMFF